MNSLIARKMQDISPFYVMALLQRAKQLTAQGKDIIHLEIGEPDFATPAAVIKAGQDFLAQGEIKYTPAAGLPELRQKIADFYRQHQGINVDASRIFITPGASGALLLALGVLLNPGETILMSDPGYPCNKNMVQFLGGQAKLVNVSAANNYHIDANTLRKHWQPDAKGILIASPGNPTGSVLAEQALQELITTTESLHGAFLSDEIYHGLVYDQSATSALKFSDRVFVINSFSKFFGMTGWRIGWLVVPKAFIESIERLAQNLFIATPTHSQFAALASFTADNLDTLENRRAQLHQRRDFLLEHLPKLGFKIDYQPTGAFYIYANCRELTDDSFQFARELLETEGVAVTPGKDFGQNEANYHLRFAYTAPIDRMDLALKRLERFLCQ